MNQEYPDFFARFYDLIYHQLRNGIDNNFFLNEVKNNKGKTLEIGVGTGRFFIDALKCDADVYGIDISNSMIEVLKNKLNNDQYLRVSNQSIIDFSFDFQFDLIIAPFRVIMHLIKKEDQLTALNNVCKHLKPGGRFIFDAFIPDLNQLIHGIDNKVDFEGEYDKGTKVRRIVSTSPDLINQLINVSFRLEWNEGDKLKSEAWDMALRFFFRFELEHLVERSDFSSYKILGDYSGNELNPSSKEFILVCQK